MLNVLRYSNNIVIFTNIRVSEGIAGSQGIEVVVSKKVKELIIFNLS